MSFLEYQDEQDDYPQMDQLCNEVLTAIEMSELRLLNWGFVDVRSQLESPQISEILNQQLTLHGRLLWEDAQLSGVTPEKVLQNLLERCLIFETQLKGNTFYRTRFAETIRLLAYLRQRFSHDDWQTAIRLVSDFKIDLKRRKYPKRDISYNEVCDDLQKLGASSTYIQATQCLLRKDASSYLKLARFQKDAILEQYRILHPKDSTDRRDHGVVIGAGTSSGKTKAYYIPTMAEIATTMTMVKFVRAMAIYPRTELLKDQLGEAFLEARKLDEFLAKNSVRSITIGAYYTDIPKSAWTLLKGWSKWERASGKRSVDGWECPFFRCPDKKCERDPQFLVWYKKDVEQEDKENNNQNLYGKYARLRCPECGFEVTEKQLLITREQLRRTPPDILFITAEMLNRCMSRANEHHLIGIGLPADKPLPRMLLLDEIHTYEGLSGSHVAYLLRRWRYARRLRYHDPLCCVGLSATLNNAESFFAKLTDISVNLVSYVHPEPADIEEEGAEYNVILKGDPVSATNLLSTSVQTVMLLARMLDVSRDVPSHKTYGEKVFAFTDKLDVISRWYYIQHDAEVTKNLSQFRMQWRPDNNDVHQKKIQTGQNWTVSARIGHNLRQPLPIGLTSSRHRGVKSNAKLIIATSALEVGFNDTAVGAVVQHKAPYSLASLLQRKGRAGRERGMRPWMVVVASDYGHDRWAFQHAEHLFNPDLNDIHLPIENYYVRKVQAVLAFMDWLSLEMKSDPSRQFVFVEIWRVLSCPDEKNAEKFHTERCEVIKIVKELLDGGTRLEQLQRYLQLALGLRTKREVESLLWDEPRSLMFEVFPTLLRDLESNWQRIFYEHSEKWDVKKWQEWRRDPLPDFITPNLFSDLNSINVPIKLPKPLDTKGQVHKKQEDSNNQKDHEESLPLLLCMKEFAPGNVNKRFVRHKETSQSQKMANEAHWLPLPDDKGLEKGILPVDKLNITYDGVVTEWTIDNEKYYLYQPRAYKLDHMPERMKDSSSAFLQWKSHFMGKSSLQAVDPATAGGKPLALARNSAWQSFFTDISSYTQDAGCYAEIARLATGVQADLRYTGQGKAERLWLQFKKGNDNAGIGFVHRVDALQFHFQPLDAGSLLQSPEWPSLYAHLRPEYFRDRLEHHETIVSERLSRFEIDWLWQIELSMVIATAIAKNYSLQEAAVLVRSQRSSLANYTMHVIFQSQQINEKKEKLEVDIDAEEQEKTGRLQERLQDFFDKRELQSALEECEAVLWEQPDQDFYNWLQRCYASSLGHTLFASLVHLAPDINADDLVMDVDGNSIWISEAVPGGIGIISRLVRNLESQPYDFDLQMRRILRHCDRQEIASQLQLVAELMQQNNQPLQSAFQGIRQAVDLIQQEEAVQQLSSLLEEQGVSVTRGLIVALQTKFLRANTDADTDELIARLTDLWSLEEQRLGCAIDLRVIAVASPRRTEIAQQIKKVFKRIGDDLDAPNPQIFNVLQSLLWLPCVNSCPDCIEEFLPYQNFAKPSRRLLQLLLPSDMVTVEYGQPEWRESVIDELANHYAVSLSCEQSQLPQYKEHLQELLLEKIEIGSQYFYPTIESVTRDSRIWSTELRIWEFTHG